MSYSIPHLYTEGNHYETGFLIVKKMIFFNQQHFIGVFLFAKRERNLSLA